MIVAFIYLTSLLITVSIKHF